MANQNQDGVTQTSSKPTESTTVTNQASDDANQGQQVEQETEVAVEDTEAKIAELTNQLAKQQEILDKARKGEKFQKNQREADVKKVQSLYEAEKARADALEQKIRTQATDAVLRQVLSEQGAKAVDTAMKLVDRSAIKFGEDGSVDGESIKAVVSGLKQTDSILFDITQTETTTTTAPVKQSTPPTVRATESDKVLGFAAEIQSAKTQSELQAVLKKYGKA